MASNICAAIIKTAIPKPSGVSDRWKNNIFKVIGKSSSSAKGIRVPDKRSTPQITWIKCINRNKYGAFSSPKINSAAIPVGGGMGINRKNPFRPNTRKINPSITLAACAAIVNALLFEVVPVGCIRTPAVGFVMSFLIYLAKLNHEAGNKKGWKRQFYVNFSYSDNFNAKHTYKPETGILISYIVSVIIITNIRYAFQA